MYIHTKYTAVSTVLNHLCKGIFHKCEKLLITWITVLSSLGVPCRLLIISSASIFLSFTTCFAFCANNLLFYNITNEQ